jgi:hypothetical protein
MADKAHQGQTAQNTTSKYLTQDKLQLLLEILFPGQKEFNIRVWSSVHFSFSLLALKANSKHR